MRTFGASGVVHFAPSPHCSFRWCRSHSWSVGYRGHPSRRFAALGPGDAFLPVSPDLGLCSFLLFWRDFLMQVGRLSHSCARPPWRWMRWGPWSLLAGPGLFFFILAHPHVRSRHGACFLVRIIPPRLVLAPFSRWWPLRGLWCASSCFRPRP